MQAVNGSAQGIASESVVVELPEANVAAVPAPQSVAEAIVPVLPVFAPGAYAARSMVEG